MKHPEGRITARTRSDRLLGCSSTSTGAGDAGRNTPTRVDNGHEPAEHARPSPAAAQHRRDGGLTNHFVRDLKVCDSGGCFVKLRGRTESVKPRIHDPPRIGRPAAKSKSVAPRRR